MNAVIYFLATTMFLLSGGRKQDCLTYKRYYNEHLEQFVRREKSGKLCMQMNIYPRATKIADLALQGELKDAYELQNLKGNELYFKLELSSPNTGMTEFLNLESGQTTFSERVEYYHFAFSSDIKVELDEKVISMSEFEFERLFNVSPKGNFYGVIPIKKNSKKLKITISDKLYDHELTVFEYDLTSIEKLPKLKKIHNPGNKSI
jgi:hypothetical protein